MRDQRTLRRHSKRLSVALAAVLVLAVSGCATSDNDDKDGDKTAPSSTNSVDADFTLFTDSTPEEAVELGYAGTSSAPPADGPAAVEGKEVWVVSCGQAAYSCAIPAQAAVDAIKAIGWKSKLCDGKLDPTVESQCVDQAVAAGADGILLGGIDCSGLVSSLQAARAAGLEIVGPFGFDCNDPSVGGESQFSAEITYAGGLDMADYSTQWGASKAAWIIGDSGGSAQVIDVTLDGVLLPTYADEGFADMMGKCSGCEVAETVHLTLQDLGSGAASQKIATALQNHPDATYLHAPFDSAIPAFIASAIEDSGRKDVTVMGSECFELNLDYIRDDGPMSACSAMAQDWLEWAAVDTLNRLFAGDEPADFPSAGLGVQLVDADHNLPSDGPYVPATDFKAAYLKIWER